MVTKENYRIKEVNHFLFRLVVFWASAIAPLRKFSPSSEKTSDLKWTQRQEMNKSSWYVATEYFLKNMATWCQLCKLFHQSQGSSRCPSLRKAFILISFDLFIDFHTSFHYLNWCSVKLEREKWDNLIYKSIGKF